MSLLPGDPALRELLASAAILVGSYFGARFVSWLLGRALSRAAARTATTLDDRLVQALRRPVTYLLFLVGVYVAVERSPLPPGWEAAIGRFLFALTVVLVGLGLIRAYGILLAWYTTESRAAAESSLTREFGPLLSKLGTIAIALVALITILKHLGVDVNSLVVSLGVGSLAVGLAAQDTLANMFAGFTLVLDRPFTIGDRIRLSSGETGDVTAIGMRATRIRTLDDIILVIPNSVLVKERLSNLSQPTRSLTTRAEIGVAYGSDLALVKRILAESARASPYVDPERAPVVLLTRFADFSVNFLLIFWARDYTQQGLALSDVQEEAWRRLAQAGIEIPFPVRRIITDTPGQG